MITVIIVDMVVNWIVRVMKGGMGFMTEKLDYNTLSWVYTILQRKIMRTKDYQKRVDSNSWEMLLFENQKLVLLEVQHEIDTLMMEAKQGDLK